MPSRKENREVLNRLFQGYVNDYGNDAGWKIIKVIIEVLGGLRITVPNNGNRTDENMTMILCLYDQLRKDFGDASGKAVIKKFLTDLKGLRIRIPDLEYLYIEERNKKIRDRYNGRNLKELALTWGLTSSGVRKVLKDT